MVMSDEAYNAMLTYEANQRSIHSAQRDTVNQFTKMFVQHLYQEHKLGYRQISKRLNLKWTTVKTLVHE